MSTYKCTKYITTPEKVREIIEKYGVAIIPNILNEDELKNMRLGMWEYLEHITQSFEIPILKDDPKTWREFSKLFPMHSMLLQHWKVGHAQFVWDIRQNPKIVNVFSKIWGVKPSELLTSFDGASFHLSPEETNKGWYRKSWYHTDQSYTRPDFECIQSWVTAYDVNEGDATLAFLEKSNGYHEYFGESWEVKDKKDWYKLDEDQVDWYKNSECNERKIKCPAGSLVLWDSRTVHCGTEPEKKRKEKNIRNVVYICMTPRSLATPVIIKKKQKAFNELRMTNHWPHKPKLFPKNPRTWGSDIPNITSIGAPVLSELGKKLAGF